MSKFIFINLSILFLVFAFPAQATLFTDFVNHQAPSAYFYPQEFDKLVLDLTIPSGISGGEDKLSAIVIKNNGDALNLYDIEKFKLWKDAGEPGFQGMGKDEELGTFTYYASNISWYLSDFNVAVPSNGLRIFISAEISKNATDRRSIKVKIPQLDDIDNDGSFDLADLGIFMESKNNGPVGGAVVNSVFQTLKVFNSRDNLSPKTVIIDPKNNSIAAVNNYIIKGMTRDQGTSNPAWVKIGVNDVWQEVNSTSSNYLTWEYQWQNIAEGSYTIKTQSADWIGNTEITGDSVNVVVKFPGKLELEPEPEPELQPQPQPLSEIEQLQEKIKEVQQKIIELLNQLIQIYLSELSSL